MAYLNSIPGRYWNQGYIIGQVRTKDRLARTGEGHFRQEERSRLKVRQVELYIVCTVPVFHPRARTG